MSENTIQAKPAQRRMRHGVVRTGELTGKMLDQFLVGQLREQAMADGGMAAKVKGTCNPRCMDPACDKCNPPFEFTGNPAVETAWFIGYDQALRRWPTSEQATQEGIEEAARQRLNVVLVGKTRQMEEFE